MAKDFLLFGLAIFSILSTSVTAQNAIVCTNTNLYEPQADPADTKIYYICFSAEGSPTKVTCPEDLVFVPASKGCGPLSTPPPETCPTEGQVLPLPNDCHKYLLCQRAGGADPLKFKQEPCIPDTYVYDPFLGKCLNPTLGQTGCPTFSRPDCSNTAYTDKTLVVLDDCTSFYQCKNGARIKGSCGSGRAFDVITQACIYKDKTPCGAGGSTNVQNLCKSKSKQFVADPNYCRGYYYCIDENTPYWGYCSLEKYFYNGFCGTTRPSSCKCEGLDLVGKGQIFVPSPDKTKYTICEAGKAPVEISCPPGYLFDERAQSCM